MTNVGDVAIKIAGRDAGNFCAVVDIIDDNYVVVDGNVRRKKCNLKHLVFLGKNVSLNKSSTRQDLLDSLKKSGFKFDEVKKGAKREKKIQRSTKTTVEASEKTKAKNKTKKTEESKK